MKNMATRCHRHRTKFIQKLYMEIIGARWQRRLIRIEKGVETYKDKIQGRENFWKMKSGFMHWANLEAAHDDSSLNLNLYPHHPNWSFIAVFTAS